MKFKKLLKKFLKVNFVFCLIAILVATPLLPAFKTPFTPQEASASCENNSSGSGGANLQARVGGVALDQAATFLADMDDITGAYYDTNLDRIVFVGKKNTSLPEFDKDDLAVAIRAVIFNNTLPAVSMEPDPNNPTAPNNIVYYYGQIEDTRFGQVLVDADFEMKKFEFGYDENKQPITSSVPGYKSFFQRYLDKSPDFAAYPNGSSRFVLRPDIVSLKRDTVASSFVFDQVKMKIYTEPMQANNDPKFNEAAIEFAAHHTQYYENFAAETPSYLDAKQLGKIVAVIKWVSDDGIASDFNWARDYTPKFISTPRTMPKIITPPSIQGAVMSGGVEYYTANTYLADSGTSANLKNASEAVGAPKEDIHWTFIEGGQTYESVAVAADAFRSLGSYSTGVTDVSFPTAGDLSLSFGRSYSSFSGGQYGVGRGWNFFPAQLVDNQPHNPVNRSFCAGVDTYTHRNKLAFLSPDGLRETYSYSCTGYKPDDAAYYSTITDSKVSDEKILITVKQKNQIEYEFEELLGANIGQSFKLLKIKDKNANTITYNYDATGKLISIVDSANHQLSVQYNSQNLISSVSDWSGRTVSYTYDDQGNLLTAKDPNNNVTTYTYDANFKLASITDREAKKIVENTFTPEAKLATQKDASSITTNYTYNESQKAITIADNLGRSQQTNYDDKARILEEKDPLQKSIKYTYGIEFAPLTVTDKNNSKTTFVYDSNGNATSITYPDNKKVEYTYDSKNRVTQIKDYRYGTTPKTTSFTYDGKGNLTQSNEAGLISNYTYNSAGETLSQTDPNNHTTSFTRDNFGNALTQTDPNNHAFSYVYDVLSRLTQKTDPDNRVESFTYDANSNLVILTDAVGTTTNNYDKENRIKKTTLPNNSVTEFSYNNSSSLMSVKDALNNTTSYGYDTYQNLISQQNALLKVTSHEYDSMDRRTKLTTPTGKISSWEYDANGNIIKKTDANGKATNYTYNLLNRLTKITYSDLKTVNFTYDDRGNLTKMVDPVGTTNYTYDNFDRLLTVNNPYGRQITYTYDNASNLTKMRYPDSREVTYTYDNANRLTKVSDWNGSATDYTYYNNDLLATRTLPSGVISSYVYDNANRLLSLTHAKTSTTLAKFSYERDSLGNITKITEEGSFFPGAPTDTPTPTATPTPTPTPAVPTATPTPTPIVPTNTPTPTPSTGPTSTPTPTPTPGGPAPDLVITSITTSPANPPVNTSFTVSVTIKNQGASAVPATAFRLVFYYDLSAPPTAATPYTSSTLITTNTLLPGVSKVYTKTKQFTTSGQHNIYAFVDQGNTISESNETNNVGGPQIVAVASTGGFKQFIAGLRTKSLAELFAPSTAFAQQQFPQYITNFGYDALARLTSAQYPNVSYAYTYDKVDNRLSMGITLATQSATVNYAYNNDNQFTVVGSTSSTYDNNGNQITRSNTQGTTGFTYNFEDRLTKFTPSTGSATTYTYDGVNNRLQKVVGSTSTRFVTDISHDLTRTLVETNSSNTITKSYIYGLGMISQGTTSITSRDYYLEDGLGNARFVTDEVGNKVRSTDYDAFGNWRAAVGQANIHMLFQGQQLDSESSLYYLRARYYDQVTGRFISKDPVEGKLSIPQTQNPYAYAGNNPINRYDPSGKDYVNIGGGVGAVIPLGPVPIPVGVSGGILIDDKGDVYPYFGAGPSTPGGGVSVTYSPSDVNTGLSAQVAGQYILSGSYSRSLEDDSSSWEVGLGIRAGASAQIINTCDKVFSLW